MTTPMKVITLKPHWAHAVIHLGKSIENREWLPKYRGPILIHAGKSFVVREFETVCKLAVLVGKSAPHRDDVKLGGIVGIADFYGAVEHGEPESESIWFEGRYGWLLRDIRALPYLPMKGQLGLRDAELPRAWLKKSGL